MADFAEMLYGGAQHAAQEQGQGMAQAIGTGAELAMRKEQLDQNRQMLMQKQQELQDAKTEKYYNFQMSALKLNNAADRKNTLQMGLGLGRVLGMSDQQLNPEGVMKLSSDENIQRLATLDSYARLPPGSPGYMPPADALDLATNPLKHDKFLQIPMTPLEFINKQPDLSDAQEYAVKQQQIKAQQAIESRKIDAQERHNRAMEELATGKVGAKATKEEQDFRTKIAGKADKELAPLIEQKTHINSALNAGDRVTSAFAAGKTPSYSDQTLLATGLATTISKRINPTEFTNIMGQPGAEGWGTDKWIKYIAGGANMTQVNALLAAAKSQDAQIDQAIAANKAGIESEVKTSRFSDKADSILEPMNAKLGSLPQAAAGLYPMSNGKSYSAAQLMQLRNNPHVDPAVAAEIDRVLKLKRGK